jgi:hypothetical protein
MTLRQGEGGSTARKQRGLAMLFRQGMRMTMRMPYPYWHIDLNAGCGWNKKADCPGSPLVFLEEAERVGRSFRAVFCDNDPDAVRELKERTMFAVDQFDPASITWVCRDNAEALTEFGRSIAAEDSPGKAFGSVLIDPNGSKGIPFDAVHEFFRRFTRIDLILNVNLSLFAMVRECKGNPNTPGFDDFPDPEDVCGFKQLKSHWLVRNPPAGCNGNRFALFIGRNTDKGMTKFEEFYRLDSTQGQLIVKGLRRQNPAQETFW